jgi:serine/threonine protein kinase
MNQFAEGESGGVFVGQLAKSKETVAVKQIPLNATVKMATIANELALMRESRHPHILPLIDAFVDSRTLYVSIYIYYSNCNLLTII